MRNYLLYVIFIPILLSAQINVYINDIDDASAGNSIAVPVMTEDVTNQNVYSYYTKIIYDQTKLQFLDIDIDETLSDQWPGNPYINTSQGELTIAMYGIQPLIGNGILFNLYFNIINDNENTSIDFDYFIYNEGDPEVITQNGNIYFDNTIYGCLDSQACNYNSEATDDDGSCIYPDVNYDCEGNCIVDTDCSGECGGDAVEDECGVCNGDGIADGACDCAGNVEDCAGECGGDAVEDECGICNGDGSSCSDDIFGCTYEIALNYNSEATLDDGSCEFPEPGNVNSDDLINILDIVIIINIILGN